MPEAAIYFQRVLDCSSGVDKYQGAKLQALEGLGDAYASEELLKCAKALECYEKCLQETTDSKIMARLLRKIGWCWRPDSLGMGDSTMARQFLQKAEAYPDLDLTERAEIFSTKQRIAHYDCNWDEADLYSAEAEKLFEKMGAQERLAMMLVDHAVIDLCRGLVDQAFSKLDRADSINISYPSVGGKMAIVFTYGHAHMHRGEYEKALDNFSRLLIMLEETGTYGHQHSLVYYRALVNDINEDYEEELADAQKSYEMAYLLDSEYDRFASCVLLTHAYCRLNRRDEAQNRSSEMLDLMKKFNPNMRTLSYNLAEIAQAELCYLNGDLERGNRMFRDGINMIRVGYFGKLFEAVVMTWFGDYLTLQGHNQEAKDNYLKAIEIFTHLGNETEVKRVSMKINAI
jgi:tetratricopeptide (TPR) repeat protein